MAIVKALSKIKKEYRDCREYEIYSDSAYVVNAINYGWIAKWAINNWVTTKGEEIKNQDLWKRYLKLSSDLNLKNVKIKVIKIKGHNNNAFNDHVDEVAKAEVKLARRETQDA